MRPHNAQRSRAGFADAGFSAIELLVTMVLIAMLAALMGPPILRYLRQSQHEGVARQTAALLQRARMEAIRMGVPVVVRLDYELDEVVGFADLDDAGGDPGSDLVFNPVADEPDGSTDYPIGRVNLRAPNGRIFFWGALDGEAEGADAVLGLTAIDGQTPNAAVLDPDGTIRDRGAFRFGDEHGNFLEVLVSPEATARIQVRKYHPDRDDPPDDTYYFPPGSGDQRWIWFD